MRLLTTAIIAALLAASTVHTQAQQPVAPLAHILQRSLWVPIPQGGPGLDSLLVFPDTPGKHPLLLLNHGHEDSDRKNRIMGPGALLPDAIWFASRGWAVGIAVRRGFGDSSPAVKLTNMHFDDATFDKEQAEDSSDLQAAYDTFAAQPEVDASTTVAFGFYRGGTASMWLAAHPPSGLRAVISFGFGWSAPAVWSFHSANIFGVFTELGSQSHTPILWIEAKSISKSATKVSDMLRSAGGNIELALVPEDAYYGANLKTWGPLVETFFHAHNLPLTVVAAPPVPRQKLSDRYPDATQAAFAKFLLEGPHKAFAANPAGRYAFASGCYSVEVARRKALDDCPAFDCVILTSN